MLSLLDKTLNNNLTPTAPRVFALDVFPSSDVYGTGTSLDPTWAGITAALFSLIPSGSGTALLFLPDPDIPRRRGNQDSFSQLARVLSGKSDAAITQRGRRSKKPTKRARGDVIRYISIRLAQEISGSGNLRGTAALRNGMKSFHRYKSLSW